MHKIGIISDTHGLLRPEVEEALWGCEAILHGGDINKQEILDRLNRIAPTYVVRGNNDKEWAKKLPETLSFVLCGIGFFMVHNKKYIPKGEDDLKGIDIVIYGHSHKYEQKYESGRLFLNPGSCGPRRFTQPITYAMLTVGDDGAYRIEKVEIMHQSKTTPHGSTADGKGQENGVQSDTADEMESQIAALDMRRVVKAVMRDTDKGVSVREIAAKNGIREELTEQICRLYLTHPGVSVDAMIDKMGLPKNR